MRYDFELLQKVRAISPTLISLWSAPQNYSDRKWRDLCGKYDATLQYWNGSAYVSGQNLTHPRGRSGGRGAFLGNAGASTRTSAVAYSGGGIIASRGLFKTSWTVTAWINVKTSNGAAGGRAVYCERASSGNDILKLECLNSLQGSTKIGVTLRNDAAEQLQWFPSTAKGIISDRWHFVAVSSVGGWTNVFYNGMSNYYQYSGTDTFTNAGIETWLCADKANTAASFVGYADLISVHSGALNEGQLAAFEHLTSREIFSFDRQFPYEILVGEAAATGVLAGSSTLAFSTTGAAVGVGAVAGASDLTFSTTGNAQLTGSLSGTSDLSFTDTGNLLGSGVLSASSTLTFSDTGNLLGSGVLAASSTLTFSDTGALLGSGALAGPTTLDFTTTGALFSGTELYGSTTLTFSDTGALVGTGAVSGSSTLTFTDAGNATGVGVLNASTTVDFSTSGLINGNAACVANTTLDFSISGLLGGTGTLLGNSSVSFTLVGLLEFSLVGVTTITFTISGSALANGALIGTSSLTFGISGGFAVDETGVLMDASPNIFWFGTIV